jgi:hypothetical protein
VTLAVAYFQISNVAVFFKESGYCTVFTKYDSRRAAGLMKQTFLSLTSDCCDNYKTVVFPLTREDSDHLVNRILELSWSNNGFDCFFVAFWFMLGWAGLGGIR